MTLFTLQCQRIPAKIVCVTVMLQAFLPLGFCNRPQRRGEIHQDQKSTQPVVRVSIHVLHGNQGVQTQLR